MLITINLGIDNSIANGIDYNSLLSLLDLSLGDYGSVMGATSKMSEGGDWEPEKILIAKIETNSLESVNRRLEALAVVLNEDSIAVSVLGDEGYLIFNPNYNGEKYDYNHNFFMN